MALRGRPSKLELPGDLLRMAALAPPWQREALLFARQQAVPFTVDQAAEALGCHRTVARRRLDELERAGLLAAEFRRPHGRSGPGAGRPAKWFRATRELEVAEFPAHHYAELAALLVEVASGEPPAAAAGVDGPSPRDRLGGRLSEHGRDRLQEVGRRFARLLAPPPPRPATSFEEAVHAVVRALGGLGFSSLVTDSEKDSVALTVPVCPLRPVVLQSPAAAEIDRGMWAALTEDALGGVNGVVKCSTGGCLDRQADCHVEILLRPARCTP